MRTLKAICGFFYSLFNCFFAGIMMSMDYADACYYLDTWPNDPEVLESLIGEQK